MSTLPPNTEQGFPFKNWPPHLSWPFPFPVPMRLVKGGPLLSLKQQDLDEIEIAAGELEQAFVRWRQRIGAINRRYEIGWEVAQITIIADAASHNAQRSALAKGYWP